jgi:hypothetical protein
MSALYIRDASSVNARIVYKMAMVSMMSHIST